MDLYPLPDLVRLLGSKWPVERLESWQPSYTEGEVLEVHAEGALRSLIWIAEHYDWGQAALDDYLAEHAQEAVQEPEGDAVADDAAPEPATGLAAPRGRGVRAWSQASAIVCAEPGCTAIRPNKPGRKPAVWYCPDHEYEEE